MSQAAVQFLLIAHVGLPHKKIPQDIDSAIVSKDITVFSIAVY